MALRDWSGSVVALGERAVSAVQLAARPRASVGPTIADRRCRSLGFPVLFGLFEPPEEGAGALGRGIEGGDAFAKATVGGDHGKPLSGSEFADEGDDRVVSGVAATVRSDADFDVRGGGRRAGAAGKGVEDEDRAFAGRNEQGLEAGGKTSGGVGAVLPPAVGAAGVDVAAVDHEQGRWRCVE